MSKSLTVVSVIETSPAAIAIIEDIRQKIGNSPTGTSFFGIREYTNKNGETSNYTINVGVSYEKSKAADLKFLSELNVSTLKGLKSDVLLLEQARVELINAFLKPDAARSEGQTEAYETIAPNVKRHLVNGNLYVTGSKVHKNVLVKGTYKTVNSKPLTIAKNELRKLLKTSKIRQFTLDLYDIRFEIVPAASVDTKIYGDIILEDTED